jgi:tRNA threonylcarbamoyladenosine biosynthesis protein TsaB
VRTREGQTYSISPEVSRQHGRDLIPCIRQILGMVQLELAEIELVGVGLGPGSYTGLRVGVTAAKTIAYATGADLVGLDTLEAIAHNAPDEASRIAVIADAQRGDVYVGEWMRDKPGGPLRSSRPCQVEPLLDWLRRLEPSVAVLGPALESGAIRQAMPPSRFLAEPGSHFPDARHLIQLACDAEARGVRDDLWSLEPRYLRRSSAEEKWEARGGR